MGKSQVNNRNSIVSMLCLPVWCHNAAGDPQWGTNNSDVNDSLQTTFHWSHRDDTNTNLHGSVFQSISPMDNLLTNKISQPALLSLHVVTNNHQRHWKTKFFPFCLPLVLAPLGCATCSFLWQLFESAGGVLVVWHCVVSFLEPDIVELISVFGSWDGPNEAACRELRLPRPWGRTTVDLLPLWVRKVGRESSEFCNIEWKVCMHSRTQ